MLSLRGNRRCARAARERSRQPCAACHGPNSDEHDAPNTRAWLGQYTCLAARRPRNTKRRAQERDHGRLVGTLEQRGHRCAGALYAEMRRLDDLETLQQAAESKAVEARQRTALRAIPPR